MPFNLDIHCSKCTGQQSERMQREGALFPSMGRSKGAFYLHYFLLQLFTCVLITFSTCGHAKYVAVRNTWGKIVVWLMPLVADLFTASLACSESKEADVCEQSINRTFFLTVSFSSPYSPVCWRMGTMYWQKGKTKEEKVVDPSCSYFRHLCPGRQEVKFNTSAVHINKKATLLLR